MRLLIEFGYQKVLFPADCDYARLIDGVGRATMVKEEGPYGNRVLVPVEDAAIDVKLINDNDISLPDVNRSAEIEKILSLAKEKDELTNKVYRLEAELKKIRDAATPPAPKE